MRDKTDAARVLLDAGWTFEEIEAVLGRPRRRPQRTEPYGVPEIAYPWWLRQPITITSTPGVTFQTTDRVEG